MPHKHAQALCTFSTTSPEQVDQAIKSALAAKPEWENMPFSDRAAIFLKVSITRDTPTFRSSVVAGKGSMLGYNLVICIR